MFAVTDTVPAPDPAVIVADVVFCPPVTDQSVPDTDQVYPVAPLTEEMLNVFPVEPAQIVEGTVMVPGCDGIVVGVILPVERDVLLPQAPLLAVTDTVPTPDPTVMVAEVVPCPAVIDQPVPVTDQVYEAALVTEAIENVFPVVLAQMFEGTVMVPG